MKGATFWIALSLVASLFLNIALGFAPLVKTRTSYSHSKYRLDASINSRDASREEPKKEQKPDQVEKSNRTPQKKDGYRLGDGTRFVLGRMQKRVNSLTKKESYEFGDLSRWLDQQAKNQATKFTKKSEYEFGDVSKELVCRIQTGDYTKEELLLLLKLVLTVGIQFQPIARLLPIKALVQMLNLSMSQKFTHQIQQILTQEVESRLKNMFGENLKQKMVGQAILAFTGKEDYQEGDLATAINKRRSEKSSSHSSEGIVLSTKVEKELDNWERKNAEKK